MKINPKSEKGAVTLVVLASMLFLTALLISMYIGIANKAQTSAETTKQIQETYNNIENADEMYASYFSDDEIIPIYTKEQLEKIGSGEQLTINGKIYTFSSDAYYIIQNDLNLEANYDEGTKKWIIEGKEWILDTIGFAGTIDGLGHTITVMYTNNLDETNQGLFETLKERIKNLSITESYTNAE